MQVRRTAVVGAGAMGGGIAYVFSSGGLSVLVKDIDDRQLDLAREHLERIYQRRVERGQIAADEMREGLSLVSYTLDYAGFESVDLAIEAVPEDMRIKKTVFAELDAACPPKAVLASNTSALSITELGRASRRPNRTVGLHFFNPAHVMKLVEVIPGDDTERAVVEGVVQLARSLGKTPVIVRECPGFLVNRLLMPYLNEAAICLQEGAASAPEIDAAMGRDGFGWPMGPLALMDMLGLDVCHHIIAYLDEQYGARIREAAILVRLLGASRLGQKSGGGFYDYPGAASAPEVEAIVVSLREGGAVAHPGSAFSVERLMSMLLNEAFFCVDEEIARPEDIDVACIAGLGMAVRQGADLVAMGPLEYADRLGLDVVLAQMEYLWTTLGERFVPAPALVDKVRAGEFGASSGRGFRTYED